ncbi:MAG: hypothetical protein CVV02_02905 [Firmicutes bacterium HGW-Firmicutes-7]|nr:MAG: hypothetical protein CVV02_02905 [Firmicutes bacterium HGW-Firmicutes-7]
MTMFEAIILSVFDVVSNIFIAKKLLSKNSIDKSKLFFWGIAASILIGVQGNMIDEWYTVILAGLIVIVMLFFLYKQRFIETIYLYLISSVILMSIQIITIIPLKLIFGEITYSFNIGLIAQTANILLAICVYLFIPIHYVYQFVINKNKVFKYLTVNAFLIMVLLAAYWYINIDGMIENLISITTLSLVIIFVNFIILKNSLMNEHTLNKLKVNEQYMPIIDELISDIKARQHDFKNHLQALGMMIFAAKDKEDMLQRYEKYTGQIASKEELNEFLKYNNRVIAGFLYGKKSQAEAMNIKFTIQILEHVFVSKIYDYEWIELFGILIDNAMETNVEDNEIVVIIDKEKDMNILIVKNKHPYLEKEILKNMFNKGVSSKAKANRGYGLYNVKQIVTKYHGSIEAYNEAGAHNYVVLKALIP